MRRYLIRKILGLFFSIWSVMTLTFFLMKAIPGDPFQQQEIPTEILNALHKHYGFDQPLYQQYFQYISSFCKGDLGVSFIYYGRTVNEILKEAFPVSAMLGLEAICISLILGCSLGVFAARRKSTWKDYLSLLLMTLGVSIPSFILASSLQYLLCMKLNIFPVALWDDFSHTILPALSLSALPSAFIAHLTRASMINILHQGYIQTAYAKGLRERRVLFSHGLRNAFLPVLSFLGPITAQILMGSFVVEKIFGIPGLGQWLITSILNRDYPLIIGLAIFYSGILLLINFFTDVLYKVLDPRIQLITSKDSQIPLPEGRGIQEEKG